ncbi:hypothetical protein, partial [Nocardiopsis sp. MG754419]|uniref:hypothetical protein n=1 Tax=Nocardiopsis sp. MG754419 TaxID=2259865 RepID=UPI001BA6003A
RRAGRPTLGLGPGGLLRRPRETLRREAGVPARGLPRCLRPLPVARRRARSPRAWAALLSATGGPSPSRVPTRGRMGRLRLPGVLFRGGGARVRSVALLCA